MKTQNLKDRLIKLQLQLVVIVLMIAWVFVSINDFFIFKNLSIQGFETTTKILARNLSTCIAFSDKDECNRILATISKEPNIIKAVVVDTKDSPIASYERENSNGINHTFSFLPDDFSYEVMSNKLRTTFPIFEGSDLQGRIYIVADFDMIGTFGKRHALMFFMIMIGSIGIGIALSNHLLKRISLQISLLLKTMQRVRNEKSYQLRINHDPNWVKIDIEEFQVLGQSFDEMIEQVESRDLNLKNQNEGLEKLVEEKAQEVVRSAELASLGEMAGGIAHEINNPLTIIKSSTKVLGKLIDKDQFDKEFFKEYLGIINGTVDRIATIINGLRNISRRAEDDERVDCQLSAILNDVLGVAISKFKAKGIEFKEDYKEKDINFTFSVNRIQLSQVLVNLLNNAFDAVSDYEEKWISIGIDRTFKPGWIKISITDSGKGIPLKTREKMFNPFYTTKEIGKGTGIGLSISKSIIEKNGGTFYYDDKSRNTSFVILIPEKS